MIYPKSVDVTGIKGKNNTLGDENVRVSESFVNFSFRILFVFTTLSKDRVIRTVKFLINCQSFPKIFVRVTVKWVPVIR